MLIQDLQVLAALQVFRPLVGAAVNQILCMDAQIVERLAPLEGKLLAVEIAKLPCLFLRVKKGETRLLWETSDHPDATIRVGLFEAFQAKTWRNSYLFHNDATYDVVGDSDTARAVREFVSEFEPDWEERLAGFLGDTAAHKAGRSVEVAAGWARNVSCSAMQNFSEYLQEERQVLATRPRVQRHFDGVARLRQGVDALERRLTLLGC